MCRYLVILGALFLMFGQSSPALAEDESGSRVRIKRPKEDAEVVCYFKSLNAGLANRWWRKFRNPSFCPYVLCAGSCADPSGIPRMGEYSAEDLASDTTPCSLKLPSLNCTDGGCCMSKSITNQSDGGCGATTGRDGCCN